MSQKSLFAKLEALRHIAELKKLNAALAATVEAKRRAAERIFNRLRPDEE